MDLAAANNSSGKPIVLLGMPGAGKTTAATALARRLGRAHVDLDDAVATGAGQTVADLLRSQGEAVLRIREAAALAEVLTAPGTVVSTGGGAPLHYDGMAKMRAAATTVWLDAPPEVLVERTLLDGDRPLLGATRQAQLASLRQLAVSRTPTYAQAQLRVDAAQPAEHVARDIQAALAPPVVLPVMFDDARHDVVLHGGHAWDAADAIAALAVDARVALLVDSHVRAEALPLQAMLTARGIDCVLTEVPGGERVKDVRHAGRLWQWLGEHGLTRDDVLVAVGGGATTDLGGFVAATWLRGMRYVAIPTSVLAMADASIGAKTAINLALGKNLIGAFHPPALVWLPLGALHSLPGREFRAGLAEIAKIFAVLDREAWHGLRRDAAELKRRSVGHLRPHLLRAIELKAMIVAGDPREGTQAGATPPRALLNFGHTLGHAFEAASGYTLRHGEAVALGMVAAAELSEAMDLCETGVATEIRAGLQALDLPTRWEAHMTDAALAHLDQDKKRRGGLLGFIALANLGAARISPCRVDHLVAMIRVLGAPVAPAVRGR